MKEALLGAPQGGQDGRDPRQHSEAGRQRAKPSVPGEAVMATLATAGNVGDPECCKTGCLGDQAPSDEQRFQDMGQNISG